MADELFNYKDHQIDIHAWHNKTKINWLDDCNSTNYALGSSGKQLFLSRPTVSGNSSLPKLPWLYILHYCPHNQSLFVYQKWHIYRLHHLSSSSWQEKVWNSGMTLPGNFCLCLEIFVNHYKFLESQKLDSVWLSVVGTNSLIRWYVINEIKVSVNELIHYFYFY